jgi:hypothetical protein
MMLRQHLNSWKKGTDSREPVARFLKSYAVFIFDHTGNEDKFFDLIEERQSISEEVDLILIEHFKSCRNQAGGKIRKENVKTDRLFRSQGMGQIVQIGNAHKTV